MTKHEMAEFLCVRDSVSLCDKLIQSLMRLEDITNCKVNDDIMLPLGKLLRILRTSENEFIDKLESVIENEVQR